LVPDRVQNPLHTLARGLAAGWPVQRDARSLARPTSGRVTGPCVIGAGTRVEAGARVGPNAVLGGNCVVGAGARIEGAILWDGVTVGPGAVLRDCIVGSHVTIGPNAELGFTAVLEARSHIPPNARR
jgi:NDP-sugar pyrophosphorylase family protein